MRDKMKTLVKAHESHSRTGKKEYVRKHPMRLNERVHKRHLKRLDKEIEALEAQRLKA